MISLSKHIKRGTLVSKKTPETSKGSLWKGPEVDGVTFSLLSKFLVCRERFRLKVVKGLREEFDRFPWEMEYGSAWHEGEETFGRTKSISKALLAIERYCQEHLREEYPGEELMITKVQLLASHQFPIYVAYWRRHKLERSRKPVLEEVAFRVPYKLPSGRIVNLRGKYDLVFLSNLTTLLLQENKTKGDIDEEAHTKTLFNNLQTMIYQVCLRESLRTVPKKSITAITNLEDGGLAINDILLPKKATVRGTLYNVVRRPLSDRHAPRQRKKETPEGLYKRERERIQGDPDYFFHRWRITVTKSDVERFKRQCLNPILEQLWDWWEWVSADPDNPFRDWNIQHFTYPWGVYNSLTGGWRGDYFDLMTGGASEKRYRTVENLFPEL